MKLAIVAGILALFGGFINLLSIWTSQYIPNSIFNVFVVAIVLIGFAVYIKGQLEKASTDESPSTLLVLVEFFKESVDGLIVSTMGEHNMAFAPFIFSLFIFLILSNVLGLVGLGSPTANYSVTLALALVTFVISQGIGIKTSGIGGHLKGYFEPMPLLAPLNIIGDLADPISLSFRLFGNILSGGLILSLVAAGFGFFSVVIAPPLHIYFDMFSGILQAFIFTMLTMVFIAGNTSAD